MKNLRIAAFGIGELLANKLLTVPTYQRSYSWPALMVENLLKDITSAMKRKAQGKAEAYFLGSVVVIDRRNAASLEVVDGQQRLATASIILAAIRDYHWEIGKDKAAETYDTFLRYLHVPTSKHLPRMRLNEVDDRCFLRLIVDPPANRVKEEWRVSSHKKILDAYSVAMNHIRAIVTTNTKGDAITSLYDLAEFIRLNTQVVLLTVDDDADAFTIFETLNDRHLNLTVADLLKNFLFGKSPNSLDEARNNWTEMRGALQTLKGKKDRTVDFVRQLWGSIHGLVRENALFRDIKDRITDEPEAREFSAKLAKHAVDYVAVMNPLSDAWDDYDPIARRAIETMNYLRVERLRPLLLAILRRWSSKTNTEKVEKAMKLLMSAAVRLTVGGGINGTIEESIYELAVKIDTREIKSPKQLKEAMVFIANDQVFHAQFATMVVSKAALARFYLQELEENAKGKSDIEREVTRDPKKVNREHIIPEDEADRKAYWPNLGDDLGATLIHRLGNQTLLNKQANSALNGAKSDYATKVKVYAKCEAIYLTSAIARDNPDTWGREQVIERQRRFADLALERWPF